jgi:hypothetical protein
MLKEAGLDANPIILSTRNHGFAGSLTYPSISKFNYVIAHVKIGEKEYVLDATDATATPNMLPVRCLNGEGRLISAKEPRWISLNTTTKASEIHQSHLIIGKDNSLKGKVQVSCNGYAAMSQRQAITTQGEKKYIEQIKSKADHWEIEKFSIKNTATPAEQLLIDYEVNLPGQDKPVSTIYLNPMQNKAEKENPFKIDTRKFPVDFATPIEKTYMYAYTLPDGYKVEELPKNTIINLPENGGRFLYSVTTIGNTINVLSRVSINRPQFSADEYPILKEFYNQIIAKHAEQIVLKQQ